MDMVPVEEHGDGEAPSEAGAANVLSEISLSETAQKLARLETAPVERRFVAAEMRMVGKVDYDETRQRTISSRVPGRLDRLYVDFTGVPVRKGDHLVYLYSPELLAGQAELIQAMKGFQELAPDAPEDLRRVRGESLEATRQKLLLWGLTPEQIEEIERRGTPSDHLTIYAPIGGIVTEKRLVEGAYVSEGTEIYTIADLSHVWVKLDAYELDLTWLRYGQAVEFTTEAYPGETFQGTIAFIDPILNARTRTAKVRVNVPNPNGRLKPGMFVRAVVRSRLTAEGIVMNPGLAGKWICPMHPEIVADGPSDCTQCGMPLVPAESLGYASASPAAEVQPPLVIPATAPLITGKRAIVYVARTDRPGRFEGREVLLGPRAGDFYLVREGLAEGEQVVSQGNLYLDSAVQILAKRSMMQPEIGGPPPGHNHEGDPGGRDDH
jgi:Cu(I)/Ag(I) efflux system membrane fusion protein